MRRYRNWSGTSGVRFYEIGPDFIRLWWNTRNAYTYSHETVGEECVETMKRLARQGIHLNAYINQHPEIKEGLVREEAEASALFDF